MPFHILPVRYSLCEHVFIYVWMFCAICVTAVLPLQIYKSVPSLMCSRASLIAAKFPFLAKISQEIAEGGEAQSLAGVILCCKETLGPSRGTMLPVFQVVGFLRVSTGTQKCQHRVLSYTSKSNPQGCIRRCAPGLRWKQHEPGIAK